MEIILDGKEIQSKKELHKKLRFLFDLPSYYGNNLDAFWDIMMDEKREVEIKIKNKDFLYNYLGEYGRSFIELLEDLEKSSSNIRIKE